MNTSPTGLRLPPPHPALGVEDGDDVLDEVAVGVTVAIIWLPGVTCEALLFLLVKSTEEQHIVPGPHTHQAQQENDPYKATIILSTFNCQFLFVAKAARTITDSTLTKSKTKIKKT